MKKIILISCLLVSSVFATDYTSMTLDEMVDARGTVAPEDRDAFRTEFQSKTQYLTPEEKMALKGNPEQSTNGQGTIQQLKDGTGGGNKYAGSRGGGGKGRR